MSKQMPDDNKQVPAANKRKPPAAGMGRVKGSLNKMTKTAKEAISLAAEKLGGPDRLVEWVKEDPLNERVFWGTIYPKLLPLQVSGEGGGPVQIQIVRFSGDGDGSTTQ